MATPAKKPAKKTAKPAAKKAVAPVAAKTQVKPVKAAPKAAKPEPKAVKADPKPALKKREPALKAVAAKVADPPPVKPAAAKPKKSPFSPKELESIREALVAQRAMLEKEAEDLNAGTFDTSQSELSGEVSFDEEYADAGTFTFERERDLSLGNNIRDLMDKITSALQKIDRGQYGICERCGEAINKDRMKALPYSVLCIRCKQLEERQR